MRFTARTLPPFLGLVVLLLAAPVVAQVSVVVTPTGGSEVARNQHTTGYRVVFKVTNETPGTGTTTFTMTCNAHGPVVCDSVRPTSVVINNGSMHSFKNDTAWYSVTNTGSGQLVAHATNGAVSDSGYRTIPVQETPGSPRAVFLWQDSLQPLGRCAASCFAAVYSQSTVPYFSLDAARGVTLVYQGDRVAPKPFVLLDVKKDPAFAIPSEYQLAIKFGAGLVPFVNGDTILRFAFPGTDTVNYYRLGGQFASDTTSTFANGTAYPIEIQVSSKIAGTLYTNRRKTQFLSVNEIGSGIARGWTVAGVQKAWIQADGSLLITDGTGNATHFGKTGSTWITPPGEFSKVTSGTGIYIRSYPDSLKVFFNSTTGVSDSVKDRFGNRTRYQYDGSSRLQYITDPIGQIITLAYGTYGLSSITDPSSRVTNFTVPSNRTLTAFTDPDNVATRFGYDGSGRLSTVTNRNGAVTTLGYDSQSGKLLTVTAPAVPIYTEGTVSPVDTLFDWHKKGVPYSTTVAAAFPIPRTDTTYGRTKDPEGHVTRFLVNVWGQPTQTDNAVSKVTTVHYTASGLPDSIVAPGYGSAFDRIVYNADGLPTASYSAAGDTTLITYGGWAQAATIRAKGRDSTRLFIGTNGRVDSVAVGGGPILQRMTYDSRGRVLLARNAKGDTVQSITYLGSGYQNTQLIVRPGPRITRLLQDAYGRVSSVKDSSAGLPSALTWYSSINRVDSTQNPAGGKTYFKYDSLYLKRVILPSGISYKTEYNALGWPTVTKDAQDHADTLKYNKDGLLVRTVTRRLLNIDLSYDQVHRPLQRVGTSTVTWAYDDDALKVVAGSAQSTDTIFSNLRGQPTRVVTVLAGRPYAQTYHYTRPGGLLDTLRITGLASDSFVARTYTYDTQKGTISTVALRSQTTTLEYDNNENVTRITYPFTGVDSTIRGGLTEPNQHKTEASNNSVLERWMGINAAGQFDRHLKHAQKIGRWYTYDSLGQLRQGRTRSRNPDGIPGSCPNYDYGMSGSCTPDTDYTTLSTSTYTYGAIGNRTDLSAAYDSTGTRITFFNNCNYTTDAEGNTTRRATGSFTCPAPIDSIVWNAEGQLTRLVFPSGVKVAYYYDAAGRIVRKDSAGVARAYFLWAGDHLLAELNSAATTKAAEFAYYPGLDNPQALIIGQTIYRARLDGLGSVIALTDTAGAVKRDYIYDDWGLSTGGTDGASFNNRDRARWKGALWMGPESDLYFMRNRWYEPASGRFLSEDPAGLDASSGLYAYANNDPVDGIDPTGECLVKGNHVYTWNSKIERWVWLYDEITSIDCGTGELLRNNQTLATGHGGGGGGGGGGGAGSKLDRQPFREETRKSVLECAKKHYGIENLSDITRSAGDIGRLLVAALAAPIPKRLFGMPVLRGASAFTNPLSLLRFVGDIKFGQTLGTASLMGVAGRVNLVLGAGLLAYDAASIQMCTAGQ